MLQFCTPLLPPLDQGLFSTVLHFSGAQSLVLNYYCEYVLIISLIVLVGFTFSIKT